MKMLFTLWTLITVPPSIYVLLRSQLIAYRNRVQVEIPWKGLGLTLAIATGLSLAYFYGLGTRTVLKERFLVRDTAIVCSLFCLEKRKRLDLISKDQMMVATTDRDEPVMEGDWFTGEVVTDRFGLLSELKISRRSFRDSKF